MPKKSSDEVRRKSLLALAHYQPKAKDRKTTSRTAAKEFKRIDSIIDQIYCDICNGLTREDIISKVLIHFMRVRRESLKGIQQ